LNGYPAARILIVDDRPENLLVLRETLSPLDVEVMEATSGDGALRLLLKHDFALILLDVNMPGMDGFVTADFIKRLEKTRHIPIIFISGEKRDAAHVLSGYETGAVDYMVKPFNSDVLFSKASVFVQLFEKDRALRFSEERFRSAFDNAPMGIALMSMDGSVIEPNEALCAMVGYSREELESHGIAALLHEEDRHTVDEILEQVISGDGERRLFAARCIHSDGHEFPVGLAASVVRGPSDAPAPVVLQVQDLTELRRVQEYERELETMKTRQLEALEINDAVVQGLVVAKYALELGNLGKLAESLDYTLRSAQSIVTGLLRTTRPLGLHPGDLVRRAPFEGVGPDGP
jgi:PAS domain S-box-containing protein